MRNLLAINGGPRKTWNTATLLNNVVDGAKQAGAKTHLIHLYDLDFKGCHSCFACKHRDKPLQTCVIKDDLFSTYQNIANNVDALVIGSPIYFSEVTGETRSFLERALFPFIAYDKLPSHFARTIDTAMIFTGNAPDSQLEQIGYRAKFKFYEDRLRRVYGNSETLYVGETLQFDNYDELYNGTFDGVSRHERHKTIWLEECQKAFELGLRLGV
jgi:multimeric flavodoxin WrbA